VIEEAAFGAPAKARTILILTAWLGTLLLSRLPQIILGELGIIASTDWSMWWWTILGVALIALTYIWSGARPLRGYFLIVTMIYVLTILLSQLQRSSMWSSWFGPEKPWLASFFGERLGVVLLALGLVGTLAAIGQKRSDYFLASGNVKASVEGMRFPGRGKPISWLIFGPIFALLLAGLMAAAVLAMNPIPTGILTGLIPLLPAVVLFALMNAFGEEMAYRAAPLSQLWQVVGKGHAIWMTALWFGLGHYYGGISFGAFGAVFFTLVAALFGKAMLETRGLAVPVFMHLWGDIVLYIFLALGAA
jgi:membrane protease YdiL (CAAX protease family)